MRGGKPSFEHMRSDPGHGGVPIDPVGVEDASNSAAMPYSCYCSATVLVSAPSVVLPPIVVAVALHRPPFVACHPVPFAVWLTGRLRRWPLGCSNSDRIVADRRVSDHDSRGARTDAVAIVTSNCIIMETVALPP